MLNYQKNGLNRIFLANNELCYSEITKQDSPSNFSIMYANRDPGRGRFINWWIKLKHDLEVL